MTTDIQKLDPDAAIDLAYDIFLEMARRKSRSCRYYAIQPAI